MRENKRTISFLIIGLVLIVVAVIVVLLGRNGNMVQLSENATQVEQVVVLDTAGPTVEIQEADEPTQEAVVEAELPPTPRSGLESTDPATVNLAAGQLQLVEVFAFW